MWMNKQLTSRDLFPSAQEPLTAHISSVINYLVFPKHPSLLTFTSLQTLSLLFISAGKRFLLHTEALVADWVAAAAVDRLCFRRITLSTQSLKFCCEVIQWPAVWAVLSLSDSPVILFQMQQDLFSLWCMNTHNRAEHDCCDTTGSAATKWLMLYPSVCSLN